MDVLKSFSKRQDPNPFFVFVQNQQSALLQQSGVFQQGFYYHAFQMVYSYILGSYLYYTWLFRIGQRQRSAKI